MEAVSTRQQDILRFIASYIEEKGRPPTNREIGAGVGIASTGHVDYHLNMLAKKGHLIRERHTSRGLRLVHGPAAAQSRPQMVPVVGAIAAGLPIEAIADPNDFVELNARFVSPDAYALRVRGTSMIEDHIADGDLVIVAPTDTANNGEIVVALLTSETSERGEATLKRFYHEGVRIRLQPAHATMEPIYVDPEDLKIQGRAVALIRQLH